MNMWRIAEMNTSELFIWCCMILADVTAAILMIAFVIRSAAGFIRNLRENRRNNKK